MLRVPLTKAYLKRTFRVTYGFTQATPKDQKLDPNWNRSVAIWPGMVATSVGGDLVSLPGASGNFPYGFFGLYIGGDGIDEPADAGVNSCPVWVLGPDAEAEVLAPAYDTASITGASPTARTLLYASVTGANRGKLVVGPPGAGTTTAPVCQLIRIDSATKITIGGLSGTV